MERIYIDEDMVIEGELIDLLPNGDKLIYSQYRVAVVDKNNFHIRDLDLIKLIIPSL